MEHRLVHGLQKAFGWSGPEPLGGVFARGTLPERDLCARLLTPTKLLEPRDAPQPQHGRPALPGERRSTSTRVVISVCRLLGRGQPLPMADMQRIGRLLQSGCTLILDMAHFFDPTFGGWLAEHSSGGRPNWCR